MKLTLSIFCTIFALSSTLAIAQRSEIQTNSRLGGSEPFRIETGSTFDASSPTASPAGRSSGPEAARNKILNDLREAESMIAEKYIDGDRIDAATMTRSALGSMLHTLDPHSNYFDAAEWKELLDEQRSGYAGIGTSIAAFTKDGTADTFILSTFRGSAAKHAGLRFGDKIVAINDMPSRDMSTDEVRDKIRGDAGTMVRVTVERADSGRIETIEIRRGIIAQPSIPDYYILRPGVGYIDLSEGFNYTTNDEFTAALRELHRRGMTALVLDLRGNGGGIVDQAVKVAEKFLPAGSLIVSQRGRSSTDSREWRSANTAPETLPLVLLVDENTASASEIVAGALQDSDRALIVGQRTFGKGLVQNVIDLPMKTGLTLTAARYYTPSGRSIQRDYSEIGRYEYYSHTGPAAAIDRPYFEARTITNRKVFGGDGIAPDEAIAPEEMTPTQSALIDPLFFFARDLIAGRITGVEKYDLPSDEAARTRFNAADLPVSDAVVDRFVDYVQANKFAGVRGGSVSSESRFIRLRLRYDLALAAFGSVTAMQVLRDADRQIERAVQILPRAGQLALLAARTRQQAK